MTSQEQRAIEIARYADGYKEVMRALDGIEGDEWDAREAPGEWSPRQIVHHLADGEQNASDRIRMIIAEESAVLTGWDQDCWTASLFYQERPIDVSLDLFRATRAATVPILLNLGEEQWARYGTHSQFGEWSAAFWLAYYSAHAHDHAEQIRRARANFRT